MTAWLCFLAVVLGWGSSFLALRLALPAFTPLGLIGIRNLVAALLVAGFALARRETRPTLRELPRLAALGLLMVGAANLFATYGQFYLSSGVGGLLNAAISLWILLLSARTEPPSTRAWLGLGLGLAGLALLLLPGRSQRISLAGAGCMGISTFSFAWAALRLRRDPPRGGLLWTLAVQMLATGLALTLLALAGPGLFSGPVTRGPLLALLYLIAVPSVLAYAAFALLSRLWPPSRFGIYAVLTPVVAVLLGARFLHEPLTGRMLLAMAIILGGVALVQIRPSRALEG